MPASWLRRNEAFLRALVAWRYQGDRFECNICGFQLDRFIYLKNGERLCPNCGSLPRTRRLWSLIRGQVEGQKVLHFSPPSSLRRRIEQVEQVNYITSDYEDEFEADRRYDITDIAEADNTYDLILCYHVLEHIPEDQRAMQELYRILKKGGTCYIQTPFKEGAIYENPEITTPEERLKHFGQEDHVRVYSVEGLKSRLEKVGFQVDVKHFEESSENRMGYKEQETVLKVSTL